MVQFLASIPHPIVFLWLSIPLLKPYLNFVRSQTLLNWYGIHSWFCFVNWFLLLFQVNCHCYQFIYLHPDAPLPLLQPYNVILHLNHFKSPGYGIHKNPWCSSFHLRIQDGPYCPAGATISLLAGLSIDELHWSDNPDGLVLILYGGPPFTPVHCNNVSTCTHNLNTQYHTVHGIAIGLDEHGELCSTIPADQWVVWNWFQWYLSLLFGVFTLTVVIIVNHVIMNLLLPKSTILIILDTLSLWSVSSFFVNSLYWFLPCCCLQCQHFRAHSIYYVLIMCTSYNWIVLSNKISSYAPLVLVW